MYFGTGGYMDKDGVSSFLNGDSLIIVFNCPLTGFCHLARVLEVDSSHGLAKSEIVFVLSKPALTEREIDCGGIITPQLDCIEHIKSWSETYLMRPYREVIDNIIRIQELRLDNYQFQKSILENNYNRNTMRPFANKIYHLQEKINKINWSIKVLRPAINYREPFSQRI
jgi:hypothetical protein